MWNHCSLVFSIPGVCFAPGHVTHMWARRGSSLGLILPSLVTLVNIALIFNVFLQWSWMIAWSSSILILRSSISLSGMLNSMMFFNRILLSRISFSLSPATVSIRWLRRFSNSQFSYCWVSLSDLKSSDRLETFVSYSSLKDAKYCLHRSSN